MRDAATPGDRPAPLFLVTDFSLRGPYVGQLHAAVHGVDPRLAVIDLMHDMPSMRPDLAAWLLPAICRDLPANAVVVAVVDPDVGGDRLPLIVETAQRRFVGPDNGLLSRLGPDCKVSRIDWRPPVLSNTFHGRDLFAPVGARLAGGLPVAASPVPVAAMLGADWPGRLERVVYIDDFGNAMLGIPAEQMDLGRRVLVADAVLTYASRFGAMPRGVPFWYRNSIGLVEIAEYDGSAAARLSLAIGDPVLIQ
jgi:S-adenosylmethionine hydrolase